MCLAFYQIDHGFFGPSVLQAASIIILGNGNSGAAMLLRVRQCVAANSPSTHASKLRPSIAAARAVPVAARAVATRRSSHAAVAVSEHRLHLPFARYAHGTVVEDSQLVFTSGTLGIHKDGSIPASAEDQARLALGNVLEILRAAGANEKNVVRINAFVSHRDHLPAYMKARDETMGGVPPTASTLMVVSGLRAGRSSWSRSRRLPRYRDGAGARNPAGAAASRRRLGLRPTPSPIV